MSVRFGRGATREGIARGGRSERRWRGEGDDLLGRGEGDLRGEGERRCVVFVVAAGDAARGGRVVLGGEMCRVVVFVAPKKMLDCPPQHSYE